MIGGWDAETYRRRIADPILRRRWAAGSPDPSEVRSYVNELPAGHPRGLAVVLGMTPELRHAALEHFTRVVSIDRSPDAHALFTDWVPAELRSREHCIQGDWQVATHALNGQVDAVFADGIFANCRHETDAQGLLGAIGDLLASHGVFVTRHVCYPNGFAGVTTSWQALAAQFAAGTIDSEAVGFALRYTAFVDCAWDPTTNLLDCVAVYEWLEKLRKEGDLSQELLDYSLRYYFAGTNWVPDERRWQALLERAGWHNRRQQLVGKDWYRYFPLYVMSRSAT